MSLFQMLMGLLTLIKRFFTGSGGEGGGGGAEANGDRPPPDPQSARQKRYNRDSYSDIYMCSIGIVCCPLVLNIGHVLWESDRYLSFSPYHHFRCSSPL